eukprot:285682-Chlamydomonas_euryale.AAC.2
MSPHRVMVLRSGSVGRAAEATAAESSLLPLPPPLTAMPHPAFAAASTSAATTSDRICGCAGVRGSMESAECSPFPKL